MSSKNLVNSFTTQVFTKINVVNTSAEDAKKSAALLADKASNNFVNTFNLDKQNNKIIYDTFNDLAMTIFNTTYLGQDPLVTVQTSSFYNNPLLIASQQNAELILNKYYHNERSNTIGFYTCVGLVVLFIILVIILLSASFTKSIE